MNGKIVRDAMIEAVLKYWGVGIIPFFMDNLGAQGMVNGQIDEDDKK